MSENPPHTKNRAVRITALVAALLVVAGLIVYALTAAEKNTVDTAQPATGAPTILPGGQGLRSGHQDAEVEIILHTDPQCTWCSAFEETVGPQIQESVAQGKSSLTLVMHTFLDEQTGTTASAEAANAVMCVGASGPAHEYFHELMVNQPAQDEQPWDTDALIALATKTEVENLNTVSSCIDSQEFSEEVDAMEQRAVSDGVQSTPTMIIDGRPVPPILMKALLEEQITLTHLIDPDSVTAPAEDS